MQEPSAAWKGPQGRRGRSLGGHLPCLRFPALWRLEAPGADVRDGLPDHPPLAASEPAPVHGHRGRGRTTPGGAGEREDQAPDHGLQRAAQQEAPGRGNGRISCSCDQHFIAPRVSDGRCSARSRWPCSSTSLISSQTSHWELAAVEAARCLHQVLKLRTSRDLKLNFAFEIEPKSACHFC